MPKKSTAALKTISNVTILPKMSKKAEMEILKCKLSEQDKSTKKTDDLIKLLTEQNEELKLKLAMTEDKNKSIMAELNNQMTGELLKDKSNNVLKKIAAIGKQYKQKMLFSCEIMKFLTKNYNKKFGSNTFTGGVFGSFVRQLIEIPFELENLFQTDGFADPTNADLDITLHYSDEMTDKTMKSHTEFFEEILSIFKMQLILEKQFDDEKYVPIFNNFVLKSLRNITIKKEEDKYKFDSHIKDIPHYQLIFEHKINKSLLKVDLIGWITKKFGDFDVNSLVLTPNGIEDNSNWFYETIFSIANKEAISKKSMALPHQRKKRSDVINNTKFIADRYKIVNRGYKIKSDEPISEFAIEHEKKCSVTNIDAPYIKIKLSCGDEISLMAYLKNMLSSYTDNLECPTCNEKVTVATDNSKPTQLIEWQAIGIEYKENGLKYDLEKTYLSSGESHKYVYDLLKEQSKK